MTLRVRTIVAWAVLLLAPTAWFAHFGFVYAAASLEIVFLQRAATLSRIVIAAGTLLALAAVAFAWWAAPRTAPDAPRTRPFWIAVTRMLAIASAVAILYQASPALLVP